MFFLRLLVAADIVSVVFLLVVRLVMIFASPATTNVVPIAPLWYYVIVQVFFSLLSFALSLERFVENLFNEWMKCRENAFYSLNNNISR